MGPPPNDSSAIEPLVRTQIGRQAIPTTISHCTIYFFDPPQKSSHFRVFSVTSHEKHIYFSVFSIVFQEFSFLFSGVDLRMTQLFCFLTDFFPFTCLCRLLLFLLLLFVSLFFSSLAVPFYASHSFSFCSFYSYFIFLSYSSFFPSLLYLLVLQQFHLLLLFR